MVFINLYLIPALALGSIYALGAVGISMIYGILRFSHFAHGDVMTIGAYGTLSAVWALGWHPLLALPFGIALAIGVALLADRAFYQPLRRLPTIYAVIASFGVALMIRPTRAGAIGAPNYDEFQNDGEVWERIFITDYFPFFAARRALALRRRALREMKPVASFWL